MNAITRRTFVRQSLATTATLSALGSRSVLGAGERIVIGVMGCGGRGTALAEFFAARPDVDVSWVCDADHRNAVRAAAVVEKKTGRRPKIAQDFRRILEDRSVDALVNATPDHWHALGTILACQAGKDVYVEKPLAHNVWEGRRMIAAARKYGRVVTVGTQTRSAPYAREAVEYIRSGQLGDIHLVRVFNMMQHSPARPGADQPPPAEVDYDLWCGPAAKLPYNRSRRWLDFSEFSCGPIPGDAVHQLDCARMLMGDPPAPRSVQATCALYVLRDGRDTPDTQLATFEFEGWTLQFEAALWTPYLKKIPIPIRESDDFPNWPFTATRVEVYGTKTFMFFGRHGGGWQVFDPDWKIIASVPGRPGDQPHIENFLQCIRSRARPAADVEQGHLSVLLCHLCNIAGRVGNRKLMFDARTETFPEAPEANAFLKRATYRDPWRIPDPV